jgi:hypothetical protein
MNSAGLNSAQPAYRRGESTRACGRGAVLHQSPQGFEYLRKSPAYYLTRSLTFANKSLHFYLFTVRSPRRQIARGRAPTSLHRPIHAMTGAILWCRPNSSPNKRFPSTNFTNEVRKRSVHGDSGHDGHSNAFPVI